MKAMGKSAQLQVGRIRISNKKEKEKFALIFV